jgi:hypothetical protein
MKAKLFTFVFIIEVLTLTAQTPDLNHQKYWYYKYRFLNHFMKKGTEQGANVMMTIRGRTNGGNPIYRCEFGDNTVHTGIYLSVLALEYYHLASNGQKTDSTLNEIWHVLNAINRLDLNAESLYRSKDHTAEPSPIPADLNGFFVRDDLTKQFGIDNIAHFTNPNIYSQTTQFITPMLMQLDGGFTGDWVSRYSTLHNNEYGDVEMSQDQVIYLLMGLNMVSHYLTDNISYENKPLSYGNTLLVKECEEIADRILGHMRGFNHANNPANWPWIIKNPEENRNVTRGANATTWSFGFGESGCRIEGHNLPFNVGYYPHSCLRYHNFYSRTAGRHLWHIVATSNVPNIGSITLATDNAHKINTLMAMVGVPALHPKFMLNTQLYDLEWTPLLRQMFHGGINTVSDNTYINLLNSAPCIGPYNFGPSNRAPYDWNTTHRLLSPYKRNDGGNVAYHGEFPGLDYMLLHNMYYRIRDEDYASPINLMDIYYETNLPTQLQPPLQHVNYGVESFPAHINGFRSVTADNTIYDVSTSGENSEVAYRAGEVISLLPGFHAVSGSDFHAYISPFECAEDGGYRSSDSAMSVYTYKDFSTSLVKPHEHNTGYRIENDFFFDERDDIVFASGNDTLYRDGYLSEVYPNPSHGEINFILKEFDAENVSLEVFSLDGKIVHSERIGFLTKAYPVHINLSHLSKGMYILSFNTQDFEIERKKIIID